MKMPKPGAPAPAFGLRSLDGREYSLDDLTAQGPAAIVFYKVSCPVCQLTLPFLERLSASTSLRVVAISQDSPQATRAFQERFGVSFLTLLDEASAGYRVSNAYGIDSVPTVFLVEPGPTVALAVAGFSKIDLEEIGRRAGVAPFLPGERVPSFKPG